MSGKNYIIYFKHFCTSVFYSFQIEHKLLQDHVDERGINP